LERSAFTNKSRAFLRPAFTLGENFVWTTHKHH
jgi:hypothetical protein